MRISIEPIPNNFDDLFQNSTTITKMCSLVGVTRSKSSVEEMEENENWKLMTGAKFFAQNKLPTLQFIVQSIICKKLFSWHFVVWSRDFIKLYTTKFHLKNYRIQYSWTIFSVFHHFYRKIMSQAISSGSKSFLINENWRCTIYRLYLSFKKVLNISVRTNHRFSMLQQLRWLTCST